jgi:hypothetical protein
MNSWPVWVRAFGHGFCYIQQKDGIFYKKPVHIPRSNPDRKTGSYWCKENCGPNGTRRKNFWGNNICRKNTCVWQYRD